MRAESILFAGVAGFFLVTGTVYAWWAQEPVGICALSVSFLMASIICFFFSRNYRLRGRRPEDDRNADITARGGPVDFFPDESPYPVAVAFGSGVLMLGVVFGVWLFLIGLGILGAGVCGFVYQYVGERG